MDASVSLSPTVSPAASLGVAALMQRAAVEGAVPALQRANVRQARAQRLAAALGAGATLAVAGGAVMRNAYLWSSPQPWATCLLAAALHLPLSAMSAEGDADASAATGARTLQKTIGSVATSALLGAEVAMWSSLSPWLPLAPVACSIGLSVGLALLPLALTAAVSPSPQHPSAGLDGLHNVLLSEAVCIGAGTFALAGYALAMLPSWRASLPLWAVLTSASSILLASEVSRKLTDGSEGACTTAVDLHVSLALAAIAAARLAIVAA